IILDKHNSDNIDVSGFLSTFNNNGEFGIINLFNTTDSTLFANYIITGYSLVGSVTTLTVTYTNSNSFFNPNDLIGISFTPAGTTTSAKMLFKGKLPSLTGSTTSILIPGTTGGDIIYISDTLSSYNLTTGIWTVPSTGFYSINFNILGVLVPVTQQSLLGSYHMGFADPSQKPIMFGSTFITGINKTMLMS